MDTFSDTTDSLVIIPAETIIGYQYGVGNLYIGIYSFPKNQDQEKIHLPPNTVLESPPDIPEGQQAVWDGSVWKLQTIPLSVSTADLSVSSSIELNQFDANVSNLIPVNIDLVDTSSDGDL